MSVTVPPVRHHHSPVADVGSPRQPSTRDHAITAALSTWLMVGLFVDGWAHNNLAELETFFTPWHATFYSGFTATGLWMLWLVHRRRREHGGTLRAAVPAGYELGIVGLGIFAIGGVGDAVWHSLFGIEVDLDALYSPTHVALFLGLALVLTAPVRALWRRPETVVTWRRFGPAAAGTTLTLAMLVFAFMYWSPFMDAWPSREYVDHASRQGDLAAFWTLSGMMSLFTWTLLTVGTLVVLLRRWRVPAGTATLLVVVPSLLAAALAELAFVALVVPAAAAGLLVDALVVRSGAGPHRPARIRWVAAAAPPLLTAAYLGGVAAFQGGVGWEPEFAFGIVAWQVALGLGLGLLAVPPGLPGPVDSRPEQGGWQAGTDRPARTEPAR